MRISTRMHTAIGAVVGVALLFAPMLFGFADNHAASLVSYMVGAFIIVNELITTSPFSLIKLVPMKIHVMLDVVTGIFLLASPWIFGFMDNDDLSQWLPHVVVGVMVVGYALLTDTSGKQTLIEKV